MKHTHVNRYIQLGRSTIKLCKFYTLKRFTHFGLRAQKKRGKKFTGTIIIMTNLRLLQITSKP